MPNLDRTIFHRIRVTITASQLLRDLTFKKICLVILQRNFRKISNVIKHVFRDFLKYIKSMPIVLSDMFHFIK